MRTLKIAWGLLLLGGLLLIGLGYVFQAVFPVGDVPGLVAVGTALILLSIASMLNWVFKEAWETRHKHDSPSNEDATTA